MEFHYDALEVSARASPETIKAAYRSLIQRFHPDRNPQDPSAVERSKQINKAYHVLSDPTARAAYDEELAAFAARQGNAENTSSARSARATRDPFAEKAVHAARAAEAARAAYAASAAKASAKTQSFTSPPKRAGFAGSGAAVNRAQGVTGSVVNAARFASSIVKLAFGGIIFIGFVLSCLDKVNGSSPKVEGASNAVASAPPVPPVAAVAPSRPVPQLAPTRPIAPQASPPIPLAPPSFDAGARRCTVTKDSRNSYSGSCSQGVEFAGVERQVSTDRELTAQPNRPRDPLENLSSSDRVAINLACALTQGVAENRSCIDRELASIGRPTSSIDPLDALSSSDRVAIYMACGVTQGVAAHRACVAKELASIGR